MQEEEEEKRKTTTTTTTTKHRRVIRSNRDHVFGYHKSHYRDGSVPSARRRVIVLLSVLFCRFRSARPEFRPDVDTYVCRSLFLSRTRCVFCVRRKKLHPTKIRHPCPTRCRRYRIIFFVRNSSPFSVTELTQSALTFHSW